MGSIRFLCSRAWRSVRAWRAVPPPPLCLSVFSLGGLVMILWRGGGDDGDGGVGGGGFHMKRTIQSRCIHSKSVNNADRRPIQSALKLSPLHMHAPRFSPRSRLLN